MTKIFENETPMLSRAQALSAVKVGDVIFGLGAGGQDKLLLVYKADRTGFSARHITKQTSFRFDRNGRTRVYADGGYITIISTARLPQEMYEVAVGMDCRFETRPESPDSTLSKGEIHLLLNHDKFFKNHLLPGTEAMVQAAEKRNAVRNILFLEWDLSNARESPPALNEYLDYLDALVDLLDRPAPADEVASFLADMAISRERPPRVAERRHVAAESLVRLQQSWA